MKGWKLPASETERQWNVGTQSLGVSFCPLAKGLVALEFWMVMKDHDYGGL